MKIAVRTCRELIFSERRSGTLMSDTPCGETISPHQPQILHHIDESGHLLPFFLHIRITRSQSQTQTQIGKSTHPQFLLPPVHRTLTQIVHDMAPNSYLGLRGMRLVHFMIAGIVAPSYFLLGYNNAVFGGLLSLDLFIVLFPAIDTVNPTGAVLAQNARVQGNVP